MCFGKTTINTAPDRDYATETRDTLETQLNLAPDLYKSEAQYQPLYNQLQLGLTEDAIFGSRKPSESGGQRGLLDMYKDIYPELGEMSAKSNTQQRTADIADVEELGGRAGEAFLKANPNLRAALDRAEGLSGPQANQFSDRLGSMLNDPMARDDVFAGDVRANQVRAGQVDAGSVRANQVRAGMVNAGMVNAGQIGEGALGNQLYGQAMNAGPSMLSQRLQQAAMSMPTDGSLTPEEQRIADQQVRAAYAARGMGLTPQAVSGEVQNRLVNQRQRQMENLSAIGGINQQLLAEQDTNRGFSTGVLGQDFARQGQNIDNRMRADLSNRDAALQAALSNRDTAFQADLANQDVNLRAETGNRDIGFQAALSNRDRQLQADLSNQDVNLRADTGNRDIRYQAALSNRDANTQRIQQYINNLGQASQLRAGELGANRDYAARMVGLRQATASDPFAAILGRPSAAFNAGQNFTQQGADNTSRAGPALFNPESSYANNIYGGNQQAKNAANIAQAQANAQKTAGALSALGGIGGGLLGNANLFK